jgi:hypothetical protein
MRSTTVYFEFPYDLNEGLIRATTIIIVLLCLSYFLNRKLFIVSNILLGCALSTLYTNKFDETILFSSLIGFIIYGYHFFRLYGFQCIESYKYTGQGIVMTLIAGIAGYLSTYRYKSI